MPLRDSIQSRPNKAAFREALGLTGAGGEEMSKEIRKKLRELLEVHFDWHSTMGAQTQEARDALEADMNSSLPQEILTPDGIKAMWGYVRGYYADEHWKFRNKRSQRSKAMAATRPAKLKHVEIYANAAAKRGPTQRAATTNESNPHPTMFHARPKEVYRPVEGRGSFIADDDLLKELLVVHHDLSDKFRELSDIHGRLSDKLSTALESRSKILSDGAH